MSFSFFLLLVIARTTRQPASGEDALLYSSERASLIGAGRPATAILSPSPLRTVLCSKGLVDTKSSRMGDPRTGCPLMSTSTSTGPRFLLFHVSLYVPSALSMHVDRRSSMIPPSTPWPCSWSFLLIIFPVVTLAPPALHMFPVRSYVRTTSWQPSPALRPTSPRIWPCSGCSHVLCGLATPGSTTSAKGEPAIGRDWSRTRTCSR